MDIITMLKEKVGNKVTFASLLTETEPKMRKTNNPFYGKVTKRTQQVIQLNRDYSKATDLHGELSGREWIVPNLMLKGEKNPDQVYLRTYVKPGNNPIKSTFYVEGVEATAEQVAEIKTFIPPSAPAVDTLNGGEIIPRDYKIEGVKRLTIGDFEYSR